MYSLKEAAEKTGKGKPAILKAIQRGRISAKKNELNEWEIDPAELHRVYPVVLGNSSEGGSSERQEAPKGTSILQREIELLRERIADKNSVIDDLRHRLDQEAEERRRLTLILTDQRPQALSLPLVEQQPKVKQRPLARPWLIVLLITVAMFGVVAFFLKDYVW